MLGWIDEDLWSVKLPHKQLCHCKVTREMHAALAHYLDKAIRAKLDQMNSRRGTKSKWRSPRSTLGPKA